MRKRVQRIFQLAKGFRGRSRNCYRIARPRVEKSLQYAYVGRKLKKRDARTLWIQQINAGVRQHGVKYSAFINALHESNIALDRKVLAQLSRTEPVSFKAVAEFLKRDKLASLAPRGY
jgi:large subunit ribosomal protein L20